MEDVMEQVEYLPNQAEVLGWCCHQDELLAVLADGGVRGGKSFIACKAAQIIAQKFPGSDTLICRNTRVNLRETTQKTFFDVDAKGVPVISRDLYSPRHWQETRGTLTWHNGSKTSFWGLDTAENVDRVKSTQWSFIVLEEANGIAFDTIQFLLYTRLSHPVGPSKMLLTTNTDRGEDQLYNLFYKQHTCKRKVLCTLCGGSCLFRRVHFNTLDNRKNLPKKYVENIQRLTETKKEYARVYVQGEYSVLEGLIYDGYDERYHIIDIPFGYEWPAYVETVYGYDHGYQNSPSCLITCKVFPDGTLVFTDEYYVIGKTVSQLASDFKSMGIKSIHAADPSIASTNQDAGGKLTSIQDLFMENGITMNLADNDMDGRIERTRDLMSRDQEHLNPIPGIAQSGLPFAPKFFIARTGGRIKCPNLHGQILRRETKKNAHGEASTKKWNPKPGDDHALDPAEYIVNARYRGRLAGKPEPEMFSSEWIRKKAMDKFHGKRGSGIVLLSDPI